MNQFTIIFLKGRAVTFILPWLALLTISFILAGCVKEDIINPNPNPPIINSISPASAIPGAEVTITGSKFSDLFTVQFNGITAEIISSDETTIVVRVPHNARTGAVAVETRGGTTASTESFTLLAAPAIAALTPASGKEGDLVSISGSSLGNVSKVLFNGVETTFTSVDATQVMATVPVGATTGQVTVVTNIGQAISPGNFQVISAVAPVITAVSPRSAEVADEITITGQSLENAISVTIGGVAAQIVQNTATSIRAKVAAGTPLGLKEIAVVTPGGDFITNTANMVFYVIEILEMSHTFDRAGEGNVSASNLPNGEFDPAKTGISSEIGITSPAPYDGNFYHIEGISNSAISATLISIVQPASKGAIYQNFFSGNASEYFMNVATNYNGTAGTGDTGRLRLRFTSGDIEFSFPTGANMTNAQKSGWYNWAVPFTDFGNVAGHDLKNFERYAMVVRRAGDSFYEWNFDDIFITRGGPYLK